MTVEKSAIRFPWVAMALSFLSSGVGHIYCGRIVKGLVLYSARLLLPMLCILAAFVRPSNGALIGLILLPALATILIFLFSPIDAWAIARRSDPEYTPKEYNRTGLYWLLIALQLSCYVALILGASAFVYEPFVIPTRSMHPNFLVGDRILVNKRPLRESFPDRGDLVAFHTPSSEKGRTWMKRVVGVAGDRVVIRGREIEVNGKKLERERVPAESTALIRNQVEGDVYYELNGSRRYRVLFAGEASGDSPADVSETKEIDITVPDRSVFLLGDNRDKSRDSRHIGSVHVGDVIGYVDYNYFPAETWSRFGVSRD